MKIDIEKLIDELSKELNENLNLENYFISYEEHIDKLNRAVKKIFNLTLTEEELIKIDELIFDKAITVTSSNSSIRLFSKNNKIYYILF